MLPLGLDIELYFLLVSNLFLAIVVERNRWVCLVCVEGTPSTAKGMRLLLFAASFTRCGSSRYENVFAILSTHNDFIKRFNYTG